MIVDALSILIKTSSNCMLPKVMRGAEQCSKGQINFARDTLNTNLDELIDKVNLLKNKWKN